MILLVTTAVLVAVTAIALGTATGQRLDDEAMRTVVERRDARLPVLSVLGYVSIGSVAVVALVAALWALARGAVRDVIAAGVVLVGANVTTQVLKKVVLDRGNFDLGFLDRLPNSLPSGHTTLIATSAAVVALVAPRLLQPLVAAIAAFGVTMVGASTVVAGWHRPADVVAAVLVTLIWTAAARVLVGPTAEETSDDHLSAPWRLLVAALIGAVLAGLALIVIGVRPVDGWGGFAEAAAVLGVLGWVVAVWAAATSRVSR